MKIKKGDTVLILKGKDKGKTGKVERVLPKKNKLIVEGLNLLKKHVKPSKKYPKGGIITISAPLAVGNVMVVCPSCSKPSRVGYKFREISGKKKKIRICKRCQAPLDLKKENK